MAREQPLVVFGLEEGWAQEWVDSWGSVGTRVGVESWETGDKPLSSPLGSIPFISSMQPTTFNKTPHLGLHSRLWH